MSCSTSACGRCSRRRSDGRETLQEGVRRHRLGDRARQNIRSKSQGFLVERILRSGSDVGLNVGVKQKAGLLRLVKWLIYLMRPARLERATFWFVAKRSIQLSYGRGIDWWDERTTHLLYHAPSTSGNFARAA